MTEETSPVCTCQLNHLQRRFNVLIRDDHQTREERCLAENVRKNLRHLMEKKVLEGRNFSHKPDTRHVLAFATTSSHLLLANETGILYIVMGRRKIGTVAMDSVRFSPVRSCVGPDALSRVSLPVVFQWHMGRVSK